MSAMQLDAHNERTGIQALLRQLSVKSAIFISKLTKTYASGLQSL